MYKKRIKISMAVIFILSLMGSLVDVSAVEISALNTPADLDLSGDIVYAINFGNNGNPQFGDVVFSQDQDHPNMSLDISAEGVINTWGGVYPNTGYPDLDILLGGIIWKNETKEGRTTSITITDGLTVGMSYKLQLIFYTDHSRPMDMIIQGERMIERYDPFPIQGSVQGKGGSVVRCVFTAIDTTLNIAMKSNPDVDASAISGFVLTEKPGPPSFTDYGSGITTELFAGGAIWQLNWGQGPWTWFDSAYQPLLNSNVSGVLDLRTTGAADVSADLVATLPLAGTLTLTAHDEDYKDVTTGTMTLSATGINVIDINASRVIVDEASGMFLAPFPPPEPKVTLTLDEATGVFAYIEQVGDWELNIAGSYAVPLIKGLTLQNNIFTALGGNVALIGGIGTFALSGQYTPDMSKMPMSFCEYGTGSTTKLAPNGGGWDQQWGLGPWDWHPCPAETNAQFLNENVTGNLTTQVTGQPNISDDLILHIPLAGQMVLTEHAADEPTSEIGQITCDVTATFVADMNATNAVVNESEGTITIAFGVSVEDVPDGLMTVTEVTGTFADIVQVSPWKWYVNGTMQCVRVPDLSVQENLMAALQQDELLLGAEEEFVLSGLYYRSSP